MYSLNNYYTNVTRSSNINRNMNVNDIIYKSSGTHNYNLYGIGYSNTPLPINKPNTKK